MAGMQGVSVAECSDYLTQHGIQAAMKECVEKLCRERPANPFRFMKEYFARLEPPVHSKKKRVFDCCNRRITGVLWGVSTTTTQ